MSRIISLSRREKQYLTFVAKGLTTDEIVRELATSDRPVGPDSVNETIDRARRKFGGVSRRQAAKMFIESKPPDPLGEKPEPFGISPHRDLLDFQIAADLGGSWNEERLPFAIQRIGAEGRASWWEPLRYGPIVRLGCAFVAPLIILASLALLKPSLEGFRWLARAVAHSFEWRSGNDKH